MNSSCSCDSQALTSSMSSNSVVAKHPVSECRAASDIVKESHLRQKEGFSLGKSNRKGVTQSLLSGMPLIEDKIHRKEKASK